MIERGLDRERLRILSRAAQPMATYRGITSGNNLYERMDLEWLLKNGHVEAWGKDYESAVWMLTQKGHSALAEAENAV